MDDQELRKLLEKVHNEIEKTPVVDEKGQQLLSDLEADIRDLLDRIGEDAVPIHPSTIQRLEEGLSHFEVTHPALTELLSRLLETLSNAGI